MLGYHLGERRSRVKEMAIRAAECNWNEGRKPPVGGIPKLAVYALVNGALRFIHIYPALQE